MQERNHVDISRDIQMLNSHHGKLRVTEQYKAATNLNARISLHDKFSTNKYGWQRWVFDQLLVPSLGTILELGCGSGLLWINNADRIPPEWTIILSDLSSGMIDRTRGNLSKIKRSFTYAQVDAQFIGIVGESVEVVIANHMLYHVPDLPRAFSEIHRILRPDGKLYAATNGSTGATGIPELVKRIKPNVYSEMPVHESLFRLENSAEDLSRLFVEVEILSYKDSLLITEADPLVQYVKSFMRLNEDEIDRFRAFAEAEISRDSAIRIPKNTGMFVARK